MTPINDNKIFFDWFDPADYESSRQKNEIQLRDFFRNITALLYPSKSLAELRIFEPGCGTGRLLNIWKQLGANVSGCDASQKMISYCNLVYQIKNVTCREIMDYTPSGKFDLVYTLLFLHLNKEWDKVVDHCFENILDKEGKLVLLYEDSPYFSLITGHHTRFFDIDNPEIPHPIMLFFKTFNNFLEENRIRSLKTNYPGPYLPHEWLSVLKSKDYSANFMPYSVTWPVDYSIDTLRNDLIKRLMSPYRDLTTPQIVDLTKALEEKDFFTLKNGTKWQLPHSLYGWVISTNGARTKLFGGCLNENDICKPVNILEEKMIISEKDFENTIVDGMNDILSQNDAVLFCSLSYFTRNKRYLGIWSRIPEAEISEWWKSAKDIEGYKSLTELMAVKGDVSPYPISIHVEGETLKGYSNKEEITIHDLFEKLGAGKRDAQDESIQQILKLFNLISTITCLDLAQIHGYAFTLPLHFHKNVSEKAEELSSSFLISSQALSDGQVAQIALCLTAVFMRKYISPSGMTGFPYMVCTIPSINDVSYEVANDIRNNVFSGEMHNYDQLLGLDSATTVMEKCKTYFKDTYEFKAILGASENNIIRALLLKAMSRRPLWTASQNRWHPLEWLYFLKNKLQIELTGSESFDKFQKALREKNATSLCQILNLWNTDGAHDGSPRVSATRLFKALELVVDSCKRKDIKYKFTLKEITDNDKRHLWLILNEDGKDIANWKAALISQIKQQHGYQSQGGDLQIFIDCLRTGRPEIVASARNFDRNICEYSSADFSSFSVVVLEDPDSNKIAFAFLLF